MNGLRYETISFLSDYGHDDEFVGVVHSVIRSIAPGVTVVDVTHGVRAHDVRAGGLALARSCQYLVPGVVLAVVDPGVGGDRRAVAVEVGGGQSVLIGPDNGLLAPAVALVGGATGAFELDNPAHHLPSLGATFAGRDIFAPCAAHLCAGVPLAELGSEISVGSLQPGVMGVGGVEGDTVVGEVLWADRFGNLQLNLDPDDLAAFGQWLVLECRDVTRRVQRVATYGDVVPGGVGLLIDSNGLLALVLNRGSAAEELGVAETDRVVLRDGGNEPADRGGSDTPVELGRRT